MKNSFSFLEMIIVLLLITLLYTQFIPKNEINKLNEISNRLALYISYTRYKAMIDNKYNDEDNLWHKKRWTLKFFRCRDDKDGIYFTIYSDKNKTGHPSVEDSLKDPLTNKNIYSSNYCKENNSNSEYVLITKKYNIQNIEISCNETTSLGQISFGNDGKVYAKLSNFENESDLHEIKEECTLKLVSKNNELRSIIIYSNTGYSKIQ